MPEFGHDHLPQHVCPGDNPARAIIDAASFRPLAWQGQRRKGRLAAIEWVPDLTQSIGSVAWFRGLASLAALLLLALAFLPRFDWLTVSKAQAAHSLQAGPAMTRSSIPSPGSTAAPAGKSARSISLVQADPEPLRLRGRAGDSLFSAASAAGAPGGIIQSYLGVLSGQLGAQFDLQADDVFDLVIARKRTPQGEVQLGDLLYVGLERAGIKRAGLLRWGTDGTFLAAGSNRLALGAPETGFSRPIDARITSGFGLRLHPILGMVRMHSGIDFGSALGTPVQAAAAGTVSFAAPHGGYGNYVRIDHGGGIGSGYGHLSLMAVAAGARVAAGQIIGYVGSTGLSTGPHLHYEIFKGARAINPMTLPGPQAIAGQKVEVSQRAAYEARLASMMALSPASGAPAR